MAFACAPVPRPPDILQLRRMERPCVVYVMAYAGTEKREHVRLLSPSAAEAEREHLERLGFDAVVEVEEW